MKKIFGTARYNLLLMLLPILVSLPEQLYAQDDYLLGRNYWRSGNYQKACEHLSRLRETPNGRTVEVDYMLGTSGCRLLDPEMYKWGCQVLDWILHRYDLSTDGRQIVSRQLELCRTDPVPPVSVGSLAAVTTPVGASARVWGSKMYTWISKGEAFNNYKASFLRDVPKDSLRARLFPLGDSISARQHILKEFPKSRIFISKNVIIAARTGQSNKTLKQMAVYIETYLDFLERRYKLVLPKEYITIYLVPFSEGIQPLSAKLHGIRMSRAAFGYSFRDDLSVVAAVPEGFTVGTPMHELFHLVVRSTFGDIPLWLDEGVASLYEVAKFEGAEVLGMPNWRGDVLIELTRESPPLWPNLSELVASDWFAFEQPPQLPEREGDLDRYPSAKQLAAMLATARYFALYAQDEGKLLPLYFAFQTWEPGSDASVPYEAKAIALVRTVFDGKPIEVIDRDFRSWFAAIPTPHK